jgi:hypothetical protein
MPLTVEEKWNDPGSLELALHAALKAHDVEAVYGLLCRIAALADAMTEQPPEVTSDGQL